MSTLRRGTAQHDTARRGTANHNPPRHGKANHGTTRHGTARQSRAHRSIAWNSAAQHGKTQHNTARHTKEHHSTKARDANRRSNPIKPPHTPERKETREQPWDNTTPAHQARYRPTHAQLYNPPPQAGPPGKQDTNPAPPPAVALLAQTATRRLNPPPPNPHCRGGGTLGNPTPLTHDPTKPAGATAQPAEPEPNPTGWAASPCVYISNTTHAAGAGPAATYSANSDPVSHTVCRPVHAPAQGGEREEQANPPKKKSEGRKPHPPTSARPPAKGEEGKRGG